MLHQLIDETCFYSDDMKKFHLKHIPSNKNSTEFTFFLDFIENPASLLH